MSAEIDLKAKLREILPHIDECVVLVGQITPGFSMNQKIRRARLDIKEMLEWIESDGNPPTKKPNPPVWEQL